jgi:hypothetical protein
LAVGLQDLEPDLLPYGAGTLAFVRMLGGAMGVNCLAIVLETRTAWHADYFAATQTSETGATAEVLYPIVELLARHGLTYSEQWAYAYIYLGRMIAGQADSLSFQDAYMVLTIGFAVAVVVSVLALSGERPIGERES